MTSFSNVLEGFTFAHAAKVDNEVDFWNSSRATATRPGFPSSGASSEWRGTLFDDASSGIYGWAALAGACHLRTETMAPLRAAMFQHVRSLMSSEDGAGGGAGAELAAGNSSGSAVDVADGAMTHGGLDGPAYVFDDILFLILSLTLLWVRSPSPPALEATQGQMDGFLIQLPYKCYLEAVASVGD